MADVLSLLLAPPQLEWDVFLELTLQYICFASSAPCDCLLFDVSTRDLAAFNLVACPRERRSLFAIESRPPLGVYS